VSVCCSRRRVELVETANPTGTPASPGEVVLRGRVASRHLYTSRFARCVGSRFLFTFILGALTAYSFIVGLVLLRGPMDNIPADQAHLLRAAVQEALGGQQSTIDALVDEVRRLRMVSGPPAPPPGFAPPPPRVASLVDTKMPKPQIFVGSEAHWPDWSFKLKAYVAAVMPELALIMEQAEAATHAEDWLPPASYNLDQDHQLRYLLIMQTSEGALQIIKQTTGGILAYRALSRRYNPRCQARSLVQLQSILRFDFGTSKEQAVDRLILFERLVTEYEQQTSEQLSDTIKCAVLLERLPPELRTHLLLNSGTSPTFSFMRAQVESFLVAGRSWSSLDASHAPRTDDPMEVDAIWHAGGKGKGKGKEKGKGKGKGKGKEKKGGKREDGKGDKQKGEDASKKFDGYCGYCGAWGHRQRDCRKKQRAEGSISQVGEPHAEPDSGTSQHADSSSAHGSGGHAMAVLPADGWVMVVGQVNLWSKKVFDTICWWARERRNTSVTSVISTTCLSKKVMR